MEATSKINRSCKIGTIPSLVQVHGKDKVEPGKWVRIREVVGGKWIQVFVNKVMPDGYFQADR